ncbi:MAG: phage head closure protein [Pseudomonadales bacterium]|nr:phage head closure protein [Pseudomonadales bacterium]NRA15199.1 phage head closure protein [Oceanospirillaceae bacterium]
MRHVVAGRKNQKITIYKPEAGKSKSGAPTNNSFVKVAAPWASIKTKQAAEQEVGDSQQSKITYSIVIGWREISSGWVIAWRGQLIRVANVDDSDPLCRQKILIGSTENGLKELEFTDNSIVDSAIETLDESVNEPW